MGPTALHSLQQRPHVDQLILRDEVTSSSAGGKIKAAGGQICSATAREIGGDLTIGAMAFFFSGKFLPSGFFFVNEYKMFIFKTVV